MKFEKHVLQKALEKNDERKITVNECLLMNKNKFGTDNITSSKSNVIIIIDYVCNLCDTFL